MKNTRIENVYTSDYEEIANVWEASVIATHHFLTEEEIFALKPLVEDHYLASVPLFYTKDEQGRIQGFLGVSEDKIEMLFIHPDFIGKGIGKALLRYAIDELGMSKVDVNEQNTQATNFYKHFGFQVIGRSELDGQGNPRPILYMELEKN